MEKRLNIPELRFSSFTDEWCEKPIGNYIEVFSGFAFKGEDISEDQSGIPLLRGINITEGAIRHNVEIDRYYNGPTEKLGKFFLKEGDLVIGMDGSKVGKNVAIISECDANSLLIQRVARIRSNKYSDIRFIYHHIFSNRFRDYVDVVNTSSGIPHISAQQIKDFSIWFPTLSEQTKIANFLSETDNRILLLKKKKSLLEQYKKGVMQKLYSQELRFKDEDGNDYPDWREFKLGDIGVTYNGLTGKSKENFGKGKPYIQYKQIFDNSRIDISRFDYVEIEDNEKQNNVNFGDAFFTVSSETPNEVGMASILLDEVGEVFLNSFCFGYRAKSTMLNPYFSRYLFHNESFRKDIVVLAQGSTRYNISKSQFLKLDVSLPSLPEQQKIATFLSALDDKIAQTALQIEKMQQWKKGLLQQLFV
jgi:type I restriction enzyme S subunit